MAPGRLRGHAHSFPACRGRAKTSGLARGKARAAFRRAVRERACVPGGAHKHAHSFPACCGHAEASGLARSRFGAACRKVDMSHRLCACGPCACTGRSGRLHPAPPRPAHRPGFGTRRTPAWAAALCGAKCKRRRPVDISTGRLLRMRKGERHASARRRGGFTAPRAVWPTRAGRPLQALQWEGRILPAQAPQHTRPD